MTHAWPWFWKHPFMYICLQHEAVLKTLAGRYVSFVKTVMYCFVSKRTVLKMIYQFWKLSWFCFFKMLSIDLETSCFLVIQLVGT